MIVQRLKFIIFFSLFIIFFSSCKSYQTASSTKNIFNGVWIGQGYQYDIEDNWDIKFVCNTNNNQYMIEYPSLGCSGKWDLIEYEKNILVFREILDKGKDICTDSGKVVLKIKKTGLIDFYYYWPNDETLIASGQLEKTDSI